MKDSFDLSCVKRDTAPDFQCGVAMIPVLIVCHGSLGEAYLQAVAGIWGNADGIAAVSNEGLSAVDLEARVWREAESLGEEVILLTDYFGGSCATACLSVCHRQDGLRLISGLNLPMLLYYLAHRGEMGMDELVLGMTQRGQNAVRELLPPAL